MQVAYLMADISDVRIGEIKEISDNLESLSCEQFHYSLGNKSDLYSTDHDTHPLLRIDM